MIYHIPVMSTECLSFLTQADEMELLVDCNLGEGGHSSLFLSSFPSLKVIGVDRDREIQKTAKERLSAYGGRVEYVNMWSDEYLETCVEESADAVFFDFGLSMFHFRASGRGFAFSSDERLDMRLDTGQNLDAFKVVNGYDEHRLADVIYRYGEERKSRIIARKIVERRAVAPIETTFQLKEIVESCFPAFEKKGVSVSTRTFQAIRIEVNGELDRIDRELRRAVNVLKKGGMLLVISFHSLEDRIVKWTMRDMAGRDEVEILTRRPVTASAEEVENNPASRSAKLRVVRKRR